MFSIFKKKKKVRINSIKNMLAGFNHTIIGDAEFKPSSLAKNSWGHVVVPASILHWVITTIKVENFRVGPIKFIDDEYRLTYHFKNKADAVAFKLEMC